MCGAMGSWQPLGIRRTPLPTAASQELGRQGQGHRRMWEAKNSKDLGGNQPYSLNHSLTTLPLVMGQSLEGMLRRYLLAQIGLSWARRAASQGYTMAHPVNQVNHGSWQAPGVHRTTGQYKAGQAWIAAWFS